MKCCICEKEISVENKDIHYRFNEYEKSVCFKCGLEMMPQKDNNAGTKAIMDFIYEHCGGFIHENEFGQETCTVLESDLISYIRKSL
jgi:hypothetical protein